MPKNKSNRHRRKGVDDLAFCHCRGWMDCGALLSSSARSRHRQRERDKKRLDHNTRIPGEIEGRNKRRQKRTVAYDRIDQYLPNSPPTITETPDLIDYTDHNIQYTTPSAGTSTSGHFEYIPKYLEPIIDEMENSSTCETEPDTGTLSDADPVEIDYDQAEDYDMELEEARLNMIPDDEITLQAANARLALEAEILKRMEAPLTQVQRDTIVTLAFHMRHHGTKESWRGMQALYPGRVILESHYRAKRLVANLSELDSDVYDCCVNSCCCFTGPYEQEQQCPFCEEPRFDSRNRPRNVFRYIPLIPRFKALFLSTRFVELLSYRVTRSNFNGSICDVFDSLHYLQLLEKNVSIEGKTLPHKHGQHPTDLFIGLLIDGVSLFKNLGARRSKNNYSCWPLEVIIYNLNPTIRTQLRHVLSLGVIPGPREPKNMNSFLWPLYSECKQGAEGISALLHDGTVLRQFPLHFYLLFCSGDIKALIKVRCTRGPNSISPCHACLIKGVRDDTRQSVTTHYVPHTLPGEMTSQVDELLSEPRSHEHYLRVYKEMDEATTVKQREEIAKRAGVNGVPILGMLSSVDIAHSMPYGFVHQFFLNLFPNLNMHWRGTFKSIPSYQGYRIPDDVWKTIGLETVAANRTIPASMVRNLPDIFVDTAGYNAESWQYWMIWLAPYLLAGRFPNNAYYDHHLQLIEFIKDATSMEITPEMLRRLNDAILSWHAEYEASYYSYQKERLPIATLTAHAVIHTPSDIVWTGPSDVLWEWVTERKMGYVARTVTSRRYPFSQLSNSILLTEQLKILQSFHGFSDKELYLAPERNWLELKQGEIMFKELSETAVLRAPIDHNYTLNDEEHRRLATYFRSFLGSDISLATIVQNLPKQCLVAGKIRVLGEKESICGTWAAQRQSEDTWRDYSFVRLQLLVPTRQQDGRIVDISTCFYGCLHYVIQATLPAIPATGIVQDCRVLAALISLCDTQGDATNNCVWYSKLQKPIFVHTSTIQCVIGRIQVGRRWGIIDTSINCIRTSFIGPEDVDEET